MRPLHLLIALAAGIAAAAGQEMPAPAKRLPPAGIAIPADARAELTAGAAQLKARLDGLTGISPDARADVEVLWKAVDWALRYDEFFDGSQVAYARKLLKEGNDRTDELAQGRMPWRERPGFQIRGYRSRLDDSAQPYELYVPAEIPPGPQPLQIWLNGRNDKRTELAFMAEGARRPPALALPGRMVLRPYGRFCNANKFAGELDVFEALDSVERQHSIDRDRIALVGFSMGGASVWHLATHHPDQWCVASPGAGFAETPEYTGALRPGKPAREWWEPQLWNWYDAVPYAENLYDCPLVAYSGGIDKQKQSADVMERAMARQGLKVERFIGPNTGHKYEPKTEQALIARLQQYVEQGRDDAPQQVHFVTYTLRYPGADWVRLEGLTQQWRRAEVRAKRVGNDGVEATTTNVTEVTFELPGLAKVVIDGTPVEIHGAPGKSATFHREGDAWIEGGWDSLPGESLRKRPGLTGPVDDAFMGPFLFVRPTGVPAYPMVGRWAKEEMRRAQKMWRDVFRGDAPIKDDRDVTAEDIRDRNLILWGDAGSNRLMGRVAQLLPVAWNGPELVLGRRHFTAATTAPILIYPNPLNPRRYVVLNSGIDFRNEAYGTNALQTPKLPDWAVIDLTTPPGPRWPGRVDVGGFFDEMWRLPLTAGKAYDYEIPEIPVSPR